MKLLSGRSRSRDLEHILNRLIHKEHSGNHPTYTTTTLLAPRNVTQPSRYGTIYMFTTSNHPARYSSHDSWSRVTPCAIAQGVTLLYESLHGMYPGTLGQDETIRNHTTTVGINEQECVLWRE